MSSSMTSLGSSMGSTKSEASKNARAVKLTRYGPNRLTGGKFAKGDRTQDGRFIPRGASYSPGQSGMGPQASSEARSGGRALFPQANRVTDTPNKNPGPQYNLTDAIGIQHESTRRNPGYVNFKNSSDRFPRLYPDVPGGLGPDSGNFKHKETPPSFTLATPCSNVWAPESCTPGPIYENDTAYNKLGSPVSMGTKLSPSARWHQSRISQPGDIGTHDPSCMGFQPDGRSLSKPRFSFGRAKRF